MINCPTVKRVVCLANSRKLGGLCVAGKEIMADGRTGEWVRPIGDRPSEAILEHEQRCQDGSYPQAMDVIDIPLLSPRPKDHQQENWLINEGRWVKVGRITSSILDQILDPPMPLWLNGYSTFSGINDRVPLNEATNLPDSLRLLKVNSLTLSVPARGSTQGQFQYNGTNYWLRVTDPHYHRRRLQQYDGDIQMGECFLTISLGEPFEDGHCYKLIAAIIPV